jgi:excisionase family DNA binding protein
LQSKLKPIEPQLLNVTDAAGFLGMGVWKLRQMVYAGSIPFIQLGKRGHLQFDVDDLKEWITKQKKQN